MSKNYFPQRPQVHPVIYAYKENNPQYKGLLKVGYSTKSAKERVAVQYPTVRPGEKPYTIVFEQSAIRDDGTTFKDHEVHAWLRAKRFENPAGEWFRCTKEDVAAAVLSVKSGRVFERTRNQNFKLRPEQEAAINKAKRYFNDCKREDPNRTPHFLWNAKMRFGKTFAAYQLAKKMLWKRILILTFKPAVLSAWEDDLTSHVDFEGWQFVKRNGLQFEDANPNQPIVCFGSFQDYLGRNDAGGIKAKNEWVHSTNWDCVILDEYHYGAWRETAKELFEAEDAKEYEFAIGKQMEGFDEEIMPITTNHYLYLSGTPFRAIATGEFIEEQIFNWTYSDEQRSKRDWQGEPNPYVALPRMVLLTYQMPPAIVDIAKKGEYNEFDLNEFFKAEGIKNKAHFVHNNEVQRWLNIIRDSDTITTLDSLKMGAEKPPLPFNDGRLLPILSHTIWFLPSVAACYAMKNLIKLKQNAFYKDYKVIVAAGEEAGIGADALEPVKEAMGNPLESKTITLTCGKLTTGVTVKPWTGIFMLRNTTSPETYFQAAFRVQSPWTVDNPTGDDPNKTLIMKEECYVFDFAPDRALRQIADYSCRLTVGDESPESKVAEFINFLPVLAYDGSSMKQLDAAGILDLAMSGTTATLLAKRWESALLVNVDDITLKRLMDDPAAMEALMRIEGFRSLNADIETIINKSGAVKKLKKEAGDEKLTSKQKKQLSEDEKEIKSKRKQIQEKLIKFATRIPVFMYLTDYREHTLRDIITKLEPGLFKKVTGLEIPDFEKLVSLGVFNSSIMNDAVYKFKRYEDASLEYTGINRHADSKRVGLYDTTLTQAEYQQVITAE